MTGGDVALRSRNLDSRGLEILPEPRHLPFDDHTTWKTIVSRVLEYAFLDRPACLMCYEPDRFSLAHQLADKRTERIDGRKYLMAFTESCPRQLISSVADGDEFQLSVLWLCSVPLTEGERLRNLARAVRGRKRLFDELPETQEEVLGRVDDGEVLWWINPHRSEEDIREALREAARSVGWKFTVNSD